MNSLDKSGSTALYWACHGGHAAVAEVLLKVPNISVSSQVLPCFRNKHEPRSFQNKIGETALHAAAWRGHPACVRLLLDAGASPRIRNQQRQLPIEIAKDAETAALLDAAMKADTCNAEAPNEYESESDQD